MGSNFYKMTLKLTAFGIAKDILGKRQLEWEVSEASDIANLKQSLLKKYPAFADLANLSFAVGEEYREDDFSLSENAEVVIIPPVAGG